MEKGQGALEYLLLIGGAVLIGVVVVSALLGTAQESGSDANATTSSLFTKSQQERDKIFGGGTGPSTPTETNFALSGTITSANGVCSYNSGSTSTKCCLSRSLPCAGFTADPVHSNANDGNPNTFWCSGKSFVSGYDWVRVDLGSSKNISKIVISSVDGTPYACSKADNGSIARPGSYQIQISPNGSSWTTVHTGTDELPTKTVILSPTQSARYVRLYTTAVNDNTGWRLSVKEFEVWGS